MVLLVPGPAVGVRDFLSFLGCVRSCDGLFFSDLP